MIKRNILRPARAVFLFLSAAWLCLIIPAASERLGTSFYSSQRTTGLVVIAGAASITGLVSGMKGIGVSGFKMRVAKRVVNSSLVLGLLFTAALVAPSYAYVYEHGTQNVTQTIIGVDFADGFEAGNFNAWSGTLTMPGTQATSASNTRHSGDFSAEFSVVAQDSVRRAYVYKNLSGLIEPAATAYVYIADGLALSNNENMWFIQFEGPVGTVLASFGVRSDASGSHWAVQYRYVPAGLANSSVPAPVTGQWYQLKAYFTHASAGRTITLMVDGVEVASLGVDTSGSSSIIRVRFGMCYYPMNLPATVFVDDAAIQT